MAEISGTVEIRSDRRRGKMTIVIHPDSKDLEAREHHVPQDKHLLVHAGDRIEAGDPLCDGPLVPHDILAIKGEEALYSYLLHEVQSVYRSQNVGISDKHIEIIINQMLRKVKVEQAGDSSLLPGEMVDKFRFRGENERLARSVKISDSGDSKYSEGQIVSKEELSATNEELENAGKAPAKGKKPKPATGGSVLLGITKAALQCESFLSAASFQETTKVLTESALGSAVDRLTGLKENVILGHLIPAGTGFHTHQDLELRHLGTPIEEPPTEIRMPEVPGQVDRDALAELQRATGVLDIPDAERMEVDSEVVATLTMVEGGQAELSEDDDSGEDDTAEETV